MKKTIILFLFITQLIAQNPKIYSSLGDIIYNNVDGVESLKNIKSFANNTLEIDTYVRDVKNVKAFGLQAEKAQDPKDIKLYLFKLRNLGKRWDIFHKKANLYFEDSMQNKDNEVFLKIVETGLIDTKIYKDTIMSYYHENCEGMKVGKIIQGYLDEEEKIRLKMAKKHKKRLTKEQIQKAKIKRIRRNDRLKREALERKLEEQLQKEKARIREEQLRELKN
jgi:hypothetical protein